MILVGKRVLLTKPVKKESAIALDAQTEASIENEMMKSWTALDVYQIGEDVTTLIPGDKVYVPTYNLQQAEIVEVDGALRLMIGEFDVAIIW